MADVSTLDIAGSQWNFKDNDARSEIYATNYKFRIAQSYSTAESETGGIWVDGKKIYRRVFTKKDANFLGGEWLTLQTDDDLTVLEDIESLINARVSCYLTVNNIPWPEILNDILIRINHATQKIQYYSASKSNADAGAKIILEYTKK